MTSSIATPKTQSGNPSSGPSATKDRRLGKGLAALLGAEMETGFDTAENAANSQQSGIESLELSVTEIQNNPFQPRREFNPEEIASLAQSIKSHQQLQPILVRVVDGKYQLISGERRLRATIHAGLNTIRAEVREADDRLVAELAIIENLQRKDLSPIEKAMSFKRYIQEHKCKQDDLARRLSIDRSTIANLMRLLELPDPILDLLSAGDLTAGHARPCCRLATKTFSATLPPRSWTIDGAFGPPKPTSPNCSRKKKTPKPERRS